MKQNCRFSLALYAIVFSLYATGSAWAQSTPPPHAASVIDAMPHAKQIDQASISPDGTQVAYIMGGELALLPSSGGRARTIAVEGKLALRDLCLQSYQTHTLSAKCCDVLDLVVTDVVKLQDPDI